MKACVDAICTGQARIFRGEEQSAFVKSPLNGPATIGSLGIEGDVQVDRKNHGGTDMAVHQYPQDHYAWWDAHLGGHELLAAAPAFGENLVVTGMTEADVHIGDQFRLGSALLEISQPRQPCWKIEHRFDRKAMVAAIIKQHNCGWYYRVIEEGEACAGDTLERTAIGHKDWSVATLFAKLYDPDHKADLDELREIAALEKLCTLWRTRVQVAVDQIT
ncbi:MAG: MOSC domain-containing protein [Marinomonas sp.]